MKVQFYIDGFKVVEIPLEEYTTENRLWYLDTLAADYGVDVNSIKVKINR